MNERIVPLPLVSIFCATFNHEKYISKAIEGFLMQKTNFPFEIIICEDKSTDKTAQIIKEYEKKNPKLIFAFYHDENLYSKKIDFFQTEFLPNSKGKYIAFCEGDDYWTDPYKLQKEVDILENETGYEVVYTDIDFYIQDENVFKRAVFKNHICYRSKNFNDHLINKSYLAPPTWVFKRELLETLDIWSKSDGSFSLMLEFFQHTQVYFLDEVTAVYRSLRGSASHQNMLINRYKYNMGVFQTQLYYAEKYKVTEEIKKEMLSGAYLYLYSMALRCNDYDFVNEVESYMKNQHVAMNQIKEYVKRYNEIESIIDKIQGYKIYKFLKKIYKKYITAN